MLVTQDGFADPRGRQADGEVGGSLAGDHLVGTGHHLVGQVVQHVRREHLVAVHAVVGNGYRADPGHRPHRELAVTVLADDRGVHAGRGDAGAVGNQAAQPRGVEHRATGDHPAGGQARDALCHHREHVARVGHQDVDRVGRGFHQFGDHRLQDAGIVPDQLQPALARVLLGAGGDHHDVAAAGHRDVAAAAHMGPAREMRTMRQVGGFGLDLGRVDVIQGDLVGDLTDQGCIGHGRADGTGTDHRNLSSFCHVTLLGFHKGPGRPAGVPLAFRDHTHPRSVHRTGLRGQGCPLL